jgi:long-chain acyl-CoA synthetase
MALDVELYRRTLYAPGESAGQLPRRLSAFDIYPDGARHTLVLLHGYGGRALQWLYQLRHFGQTMRVIAPELRGHGYSADEGSAPITMASLVDDLETVLDGLGAQTPFQLIAHSFGGAVAAEYALRHPEHVAGLVLIGVPARFILRRGARELMNVPAPVFGSLVRRLDIALYANVPTMRRMHDGAMAIWRGDERLPLLRVPTLAVLGHRDTVFAQDHYAVVPKLIPGARQVTVPVSAHLVQLERPDAVNRAILRFIQPAPAARAVPEVAGLGQAAPISQALAKYAARPWLQHYDDGVPEDLPLPRQPLHEMLSNAALEHPDRAAIIFFGQKIGYHELDQLTNRFAHALKGMGVQKGDRVAIVLPNVPQCIIAYYGSLKAGAVVALGSPLSSPTEIANQLRDSGATVLVTLSTYQKLVDRLHTGAVGHVIYTDVREYLPLPARLRLARTMDAGVAYPDRAVIPPAEAAPAPKYQQYALQPLLRTQPTTLLPSVTTSDDLAVIQYTSGTTDKPRGVMLTHGNLVMNVAQMRHWIPDLKRGQEAVLCVLPLSHSYGMTAGLNVSIGISASIALLPTWRPRPIVEAIRSHHPSLFPGVPALYVAIANYPRIRTYGISSVRYCVSGSASLPVEVQEAFEKLTRGRLIEGYGLTEAAPGTHANPFKGERRVGSVGIPYPSTEARIVHPETGEPLAPGEVGELVIRGPQVMRGYWNLPDDTARALRDGWLHTEDLAQMDDDGFFSIVERKKNVILSGPYNIYPREVEEVLYEHPKVLEAVVVGEPAPGGDGATHNAIVKAVVVLRRGEKATAEELLALCRERLDAYKVPRQIEFRTELPKNFVGKVLRRLLVGTE